MADPPESCWTSAATTADFGTFYHAVVRFVDAVAEVIETVVSRKPLVEQIRAFLRSQISVIPPLRMECAEATLPRSRGIKYVHPVRSGRRRQ